MEKMIQVLIVDDDKEIRDLLADFLGQYNYRISLARDGNEMRKKIAKDDIDLIILDVMMPGDDGLTLCREIRARSTVPIIMLTAAGEETDRIIGLEMGADDYIAKPFNPRELLARIKAILRRSNENGHQIQQEQRISKRSFEGWRLDLATRALISPDGMEVSLSAGEYDLLVAFLENPQRVLSRDQLLDITKNRTAGPFDRSIDVQISRLRHKIEPEPKNPTLIKTVRGGGYLFTPVVEMVA